MKTMGQHSTVKLGLILGAIVIESWIWARPAVSQQGFELPLCYMQTETGEIVDLTRLCADLEDSLVNQAQSSRPATTSRQITPARRGRGAMLPSRSQSSNSIQNQSLSNTKSAREP